MTAILSQLVPAANHHDLSNTFARTKFVKIEAQFFHKRLVSLPLQIFTIRHRSRSHAFTMRFWVLSRLSVGCKQEQWRSYVGQTELSHITMSRANEKLILIARRLPLSFTVGYSRSTLGFGSYTIQETTRLKTNHMVQFAFISVLVK